MTMDQLMTPDDWHQLELHVSRLFSAAPFSAVGSLDHGPLQDLYPGRTLEISVMMRAVRDPAKHILLYGERSLGKTSLSNTFWRNQSSMEQPVLAARVQVYPSDDFSSLWLRALEEFKTVFGYDAQDIRTDFANITPDIVRREFQKLPARLGAIMIVDEFDLLQGKEARELTANLLKSLHDHSVSVTILLIGVAENIEDLIINHQSLRRVLTLVKLGRMNIADSAKILDSRLLLTPLRISDDARAEIVTLACGLPFYVQTLGRFAAQNALKNRRLNIEPEDVRASLDNFLDESGKSFDQDYVVATDTRRESNNMFRKVIFACALAPCDSGGMFRPSDVSDTLSLIEPEISYHPRRIQQYLAQFVSERRGGILIRNDTNAGYRYRFSDALMQPYILMRGTSGTMIDERLRSLLLQSGKEALGEGEANRSDIEHDAPGPSTIMQSRAEEAGPAAFDIPAPMELLPSASEAEPLPASAGFIRAVRDSSRTGPVRPAREGAWRLFRRRM